MANSLERAAHHTLIILEFPTVIRVFTEGGLLVDEYCPECLLDPHRGVCE